MGGLQRINWRQIDTERVPSGSQINLGSLNNPLNLGFFNNIIISGTSILDYLQENSLWVETPNGIETTNDVKIKGNLYLDGNLIVNGQTVLIPKHIDEPTLSVTGSLSIMDGNILSNYIKSKLFIENLGSFGNNEEINIIDCGDNLLL